MHEDWERGRPARYESVLLEQLARFKLEETCAMGARASCPHIAWEAGGTPALPSFHEAKVKLRKSKFVVADLTGKNAGAYFEAGFALGLNKPVIWTCSQADIDKKDGVHFDTRQYSIVSWDPDNLADFATRLTQRIEATIGRGRYVAAAK